MSSICFRYWAEAEESDREHGNEHDCLPGILQRPMLQSGKVVGEKQEAEEIDDENHSGNGFGTADRNT